VKNAIISFVVSALIGLGIGYIVFDVVGDSDKPSEVAVDKEKATDTEDNSSEKATKDSDKGDTVTADADGGILAAKGCLGCHSVEGLNLTGGATGPDLSQAFSNVEGKHGKPLDQFLKEPTSAVMSGVISGNPLSDDEIKEVLDMLKQASEAK
jgi:cytochrome c2